MQHNMGSISSVYVNPSDASITEPGVADENDGMVLYNDEIRGTTQEQQKNTMEICLRHSFNITDKNVRESDMGITIQYLAEENAKLALTNRDLKRMLETLKKERDTGQLSDVEVYGETAEQRLYRLEKILECERKEKWKAIEDCEKIRVDLENCEKELMKKDEKVRRTEEELARIQKSLPESFVGEEVKISESERRARRESEMEAFKADLMVKREIRQKALTSVSSELQKLRQELETERSLRCSQENDLVKTLTLENEKLKSEFQKLDKEKMSLNTLVIRLKSNYEEEKRKYENTLEEKSELELEKEKKIQIIKELEMEKEKMWADYDREKVEVNKRTMALKDVVEISRQMLTIRENQVQELKKKLREIEESVNNSKLMNHNGLKEEYEKQLQNIKTLKELYEERVRLMEVERDKLNETVSQHAKTIQEQMAEIEGLKEQIGETSEELKKERFQNESLERELRISAAKSKDLENELSLINNLFTQMLLGPYNTGNETDLDKLTELLQENHDLITQLVLRENSSEIASALPKLLLDLITQVDGNGQSEGREQEPESISEHSDSISDDAVLPILSYKKAVLFEVPTEEAEEESKEVNENKRVKTAPEASKANDQMNPAVQEIASNLPKVWRVLMELLSHHTVPDGPPPGDEKQCYKNVETPNGTRSVISVSNTFIRLKDLILEKKALQKELTRLKQLNSHLEGRLDDQEKRLSHVQCELHKTWGIVGRMRAQHQQLHNHERILRYELQEKRVMLSELKQELEYCKEKWERARQKNDESETQWQKLRREFAARKSKSHPTKSLNDSGESGFSDEPNESGEEGENFYADRSNTESPVGRKSRETSCMNENPEQDYQDTVVDEASGSMPDDERLRQREARLKRLEDQCQLLVKKVDITTSKSNYLSNRLEELHEQYGGPEVSGDQKTDQASNQGPSSTCSNDHDDEGATMCLQPPVEPDNVKPVKTMEEILNARSERLRRLEEQCQSLVGKVSNTVERGVDLSNKLEELHMDYLQSEERRTTNNAESAAGAEESTKDITSPDNEQSEDNEKTE